MSFSQAGLIGILGIAGCAPILGTIVTTPAGLAPGTTYQLVFVTSDGYYATSGSISDYNLDVTTEAALNASLAAFDSANGVTWTVIGSTTSVNALTNSPSSGLVFTLNGAEVASTANTLYSGTLLSPIDIDENGNLLNTAAVWTGSLENGTVAGGLGALGQTFPDEGGSGLTTGWASGVTHGVFSDNYQNLYAISSVLTVPVSSSAPEPGTLALVPAGLGILFYVRRRVRSCVAGDKQAPVHFGLGAPVSLREPSDEGGSFCRGASVG